MTEHDPSPDLEITATEAGARTWSYRIELIFWAVVFLGSVIVLLGGLPGVGVVDGLLVRLGALLGAPLSFLLGRNVVQLIRDDRPPLLITDEGVLNRTYSSSAEFVPWEEILEVRKTRFPTVLEIVLRDPDEFRARQTLTTKIFMRATSFFGPGPFLVYLPQLRESGSELLEELSAALDKTEIAAVRGERLLESGEEGVEDV